MTAHDKNPYEKGRDSNRDGKDKSKNPYPQGSKDAKLWDEGFAWWNKWGKLDSACAKVDSMSKVDAQGYIVKRVEGYELIQGVGPDGGDWLVRHKGKTQRFKTRDEAEHHIDLETEDDE